MNFPALSGGAGGGGGGGTVVEPYIIVQPEFSAPVGMRNRLCHELHLCHCNPECDISHPVSADHIATTGCRLSSSSSCPLSCVQNNLIWAILLPTFAEVKPSCSTWVTPIIPNACLVKGGRGKKRCGMKVRSEKKKNSPFKQNGTECLRVRLTGPHAAHLPGCQEFRFTLAGTSRTHPPTPICLEGQTVLKVQQMGSSSAYEVALCAMMSVLPKPPPIPRLCPHSQSKIITLHYRLQTGPVNILPLGCTQSSGMHLNGRSLLRISTQRCTPGLPCLQKFTSWLSEVWNRLTRAELDFAAVQRSLGGELGFCGTSVTATFQFKDVCSCCHFLFNEFAELCWCTAALLPQPIAIWPSDLALQMQGDRQFATPTLITVNCKTLLTKESELKTKGVFFESGPDCLGTTVWKHEASGFVVCREVCHRFLLRVQLLSDP